MTANHVTRHRIREIVAAAALLLPSSCALGDGDYFATVDAELHAELEVPPDRDLGDGWQRLASDYEVRVDVLALELEALELLDTGGPAATFDPANPPPGYSGCHGGHCHAEDGSLVDYEEIAAELAGSGGAAVALSFPVGEVELVGGSTIALPCNIEDCGLVAPADITLGRAHAHGVRIAGVVRDGRDPARVTETPFVFEVELAEGDDLELTGALDLPANRTHDPDVELDIDILVGTQLLDAVAFAELPAGDDIDLAADEEARTDILERLGEVALVFDVTRQ